MPHADCYKGGNERTLGEGGVERPMLVGASTSTTDCNTSMATTMTTMTSTLTSSLPPSSSLVSSNGNGSGRMLWKGFGSLTNLVGGGREGGREGW